MFSPAGMGVLVRTQPGGQLYTNSGQVPSDWSGYESISFWVLQSPDDGQRSPAPTLEIRLFEADDQTRFWRWVELDHEGWTRITLPLRWFRWEEGRIPRWDRVYRLAFYFRDAATLWIDEITVESGTDPSPAHLDSEDITDMAFPGVAREDLVINTSDAVRIVTDAQALDAAALAVELEQVQRAVLADMPFLDAATPPPPLVICETEQVYRAFVGRLAAAFGVTASPPTHDGYTMIGLAASSWSGATGTQRPTYTHEYVHALLARSALLPNHGEGLQENLATRYQQRFHPQADLSDIVRDGLAEPDHQLPLERLCNG